jgi:hypothetical protein
LKRHEKHQFHPQVQTWFLCLDWRLYFFYVLFFEFWGNKEKVVGKRRREGKCLACYIMAIKKIDQLVHFIEESFIEMVLFFKHVKKKKNRNYDFLFI